MQLNDSIRLYRALSDLARRYQFRNKEEVCCYGLTVSQCYALEMLLQESQMRVSDLATSLGLDLSSTTRLVDHLVRKKLVVRRRSQEDARIKELKLTEAGERLIQRLEEDFGKTLLAALSDFPEEVKEALPEVLRRLRKTLDTCGPMSAPLKIRTPA